MMVVGVHQVNSYRILSDSSKISTRRRISPFNHQDKHPHGRQVGRIGHKSAHVHFLISYTLDNLNLIIDIRIHSFSMG